MASVGGELVGNHRHDSEVIFLGSSLFSVEFYPEPRHTDDGFGLRWQSAAATPLFWTCIYHPSSPINRKRRLQPRVGSEGALPTPFQKFQRASFSSCPSVHGSGQTARGGIRHDKYFPTNKSNPRCAVTVPPPNCSPCSILPPVNFGCLNFNSTENNEEPTNGQLRNS
jgi:hypothetical protein